MTKKTEATKAPTERTDAQGDHSEQPVTKLAEISADDGTNDRENSANQDVADHLRDTKADAKAKKFGDPDINLSGGHGPGVGGPG